MTFALNLTNITNAIAALNIAGVTVKDSDEIMSNWISLPNVLYPNPNQDAFLTGFALQYDSVLQGADAPITVSYTLNYRFLGSQIGDMGTFTQAYADVLAKVILIVNAIIALPGPYSGTVDMELTDVTIGGKQDPAGNQYHGADFALKITEMQN